MRTTVPVTSGAGRARALRAVGTLALLAVVGGTLTLPDAASAVPPADVTGAVTDPGDVLGDRTDEVRDALARVEQDTDLRLLVVLVPTFDGMDGVDWANASASASGLGADELLLAIATDEDRIGLSADTSGVLDADDLDRVRLAAEGPLRERDWAGAVIAAADTVRDVAAGPGSAGRLPVLVGAAAVLLVLAVGAGLLVRRGRQGSVGRGARGDRAGSVRAEADLLPVEALEARARAAFVAADDALRAAAEGASRARGPEPVASPADGPGHAPDDGLDPVRATLARSAAQLRGQETAETTAKAGSAPSGERRATLARVEELCAAATARLPRAPAGAPSPGHEPVTPDVVAETAADVLDRAATARDTVTVLTLAYHPDAFAPVEHNPDRAAALATTAQTLVDQAREAPVRRGAGAGPGDTLRVAEQALAQADVLLGAVVRAAFDLGTTAAAVQRGVRSLTADVADAARRSDAGPAVSTALDAARQALDEAATVDGVSDPTRALEQLSDAEAALDAALRGARDRSEVAARTNALLRETLAYAHRRLTASGVVLTTRRGAVGAAARLRWWEASDLYDHALDSRTTAPREALDAARAALVAVRESLLLAAGDVAQWDADGHADGTPDALALGGLPRPAEPRPRPRGPRRPAPA